MNRDQFNEWVRNPGLLGQESLPLLQQMVEEYPFFQTARVLYLLNLRKLNDYRYDRELRRAAVASADRAHLRRLVTGLGLTPAAAPAVGVPEENIAGTGARESEKDHEKLAELEARIKARLKELDEGRSSLRKLLEEKEILVNQNKADLGADGPQIADRPFRTLPKDDLLEEFIRERKTNSDGQGAFYSPEESARKSIEENEGIISETLARLIAAQGKFDKAIKIYEQLMLKNPQKSSYFAAQIEKLRKEL